MATEIKLHDLPSTVPAFLIDTFSVDEWTEIRTGVKACSLRPDEHEEWPGEGFVRFFVFSVFMFIGISVALYALVTFEPSGDPTVCNLHWIICKAFGLAIVSLPAIFFICLSVTCGFASDWLCNYIFGQQVSSRVTGTEYLTAVQNFFASEKMAALLKREKAKLKIREYITASECKQRPVLKFDSLEEA